MFSSSPNYTKLKTHLRLAINRLKLLEKKKTELTQKARKEIADYLQAGKIERAKIRVEHIIREDYLVEAMEVVEMYCDLVLARFGLITQMNTLDEGIAEAVSSLIWVSPRLQSDVAELKVISDLLAAKYGKPYGDACRAEAVATISEKLKHKLSIQTPPKLLVEKYLIEIAKIYNIEYEPDPQVMQEEKGRDAMLIDLSDKNNLGMPQPPGFVGYPQPPMAPFSYPPLMPHDQKTASASAPPNNLPFGTPFSYNIPPGAESKESNTTYNDDIPPSYSMVSPDDNIQSKQQEPKPAPRSKIPGNFSDLPELPSVPSDNSLDGAKTGGDDIDFDDLTRRFEELKKRK
ncbi:IST1 homolog [Agrilus planipennis]|uniref:IST1 homolog n=1 Tax=Agrilus planipennis TaxID=224129 RepID=A0A1W4X2X1_AGRPL|nr:IST1 homolog [Agrilus planipennis]XP_025831454.1 IST1 homolog [Agrilus planipennis]